MLLDSARTSRKSRRPLLSRRSDLVSPETAGLFLGWQSEEVPPSFGFARSAPAPAPVHEEPLWYSGDGHLLTVAPTGAGKGVGVIIPTLLTYPGSIIVTDIKGENYQVTARRRREMGQQVVVLDPFGLVTDQSDALNPFDLFKLRGADMESDAEMLAAQLAVGHAFGTDRYWEDTGRGILSGLVAYLATGAKPEDRNMSGLRRMLYHDDMDYQLAVILDAKGHGCQLARDEFVSYLSAPADKTRPCIRSTATTFVKCLGSAKVARTLEKSTFDLADVVAGKPLTIYLVIPPEKLSSHQALLRLWVGTLLTAVVRRKRIPQRRTLFMIDEAAQLGRMELLCQAITLLRGYGMQVWTFWQDLSQLRLLYPSDWETIVANAAVLQAFGVPRYSVRRSWPDVLGSAARELAQLDRGEMLVALGGDHCKRHRRASYLHDQVFSGMFDANERFGKPDAEVR